MKKVDLIMIYITMLPGVFSEGLTNLPEANLNGCRAGPPGEKQEAWNHPSLSASYGNSSVLSQRYTAKPARSGRKQR
ncbi:MAG: hypothetical protein K0S11_1753 [Gammaproteobacteria bacterium]|nr:hypothetical protein [Gammaproteobacteria bacterium]